SGSVLNGTGMEGSIRGIDISNRENVVIKNCVVMNYEIGIGIQGSNDIDLFNNTIMNNGAGLPVFDSMDITIENNTISSNDAGIDIINSSYCDIFDNAITDNTGGIDLHISNFNFISHNDLTGNYDGIYLSNSSNNSIINNSLELNTNGIFLLFNSSGNHIINNTANSNWDYGIYLEESSNNTLSNNILNFNTIGLRLEDYSSGNKIINNTANYNWQVGVYLHSPDNILINNTFCSNDEYDIYNLDMDANSGDNNTCNETENWDDDNSAGCTYSCPLMDCNCSTCNECTFKLSRPECSVVTLTKDIKNYTGKICIDEWGDGKTFDCRGHTIDGTGENTGIYTDYAENLTIKNCILTGWLYGIHLYSSSNNTLNNNTIYDNENGIYIEFDSDYNNIYNNDIGDNNKGIHLSTVNETYAGGIKTDTGTYRLVYFSFGFEAINNETDRNTVMNRTINYLGGGDVLLVGDGRDDSENDELYDYYADSLDNNGISHTYWDTDLNGSPDYDDLIYYDIVVWFVGDMYPDEAEQEVLEQYLDEGGNLFITGQDIGYYLIDEDEDDGVFYSDYLHANYTEDVTESWSLHGVDGDIGGNLSIEIEGGSGADNQDWPSGILPINGSEAVFYYDMIYPEFNDIYNNDITDNDNEGVYIEYGNDNILNNNFVCGNLIDINILYGDGNSGDDNACDLADEWNDDGINGCRYTCSGFPGICDLNQDGIIVKDYNDLMSAYKCFLGIKNCNGYHKNWNIMKQEYECFTNNK
ncbi:MAG: hypothetical protein A7315_11695, partial [Candidatus Altiarchaeales archaeon WOR_SM1_79]